MARTMDKRIVVLSAYGRGKEEGAGEPTYCSFSVTAAVVKTLKEAVAKYRYQHHDIPLDDVVPDLWGPRGVVERF